MHNPAAGFLRGVWGNTSGNALLRLTNCLRGQVACLQADLSLACKVAANHLERSQPHRLYRVSTKTRIRPSRLAYLSSNHEPMLLLSVAMATQPLRPAAQPFIMSLTEKKHPCPSLSAIDVAEVHLAALQTGDAECAFRFSSPKCKDSNGPLERYSRMMQRAPAYQPLFRCTRYSIVGALEDGSVYRCCVRVWPAGSSSAPFAIATPLIDYNMVLTRHSLSNQEQTCWLVDGLVPDDSPALS